MSFSSAPLIPTRRALNADAEAQRIHDAGAQGQPPAAAGPNAASTAPPAKHDDSATIKKDSGGWFDGIF